MAYSCGGASSTSFCSGIAKLKRQYKGCPCYSAGIYAATIDSAAWAAGFNLPTLTSSVAPTSSATLPGIKDWNCSGKDQCNIGLEKSTCEQAIAHYDNDTMYSDYNSEVQNPVFGYGATALFTCPKGSCPPGGIKGSEVKERISAIWDRCGLCGSITYADGIMVTINACNKPCKRYHDGSPA